MAISNPELWERVRAHPLPWRDVVDNGVSPARRCQSSKDNLPKDGDWTEVSAARLVMEYRKFLYPKALDGGVLTLPTAIDAAWHLHQGFGSDCVRFCKEVLGRIIVHNENLTQSQRVAAYQRLLALYDAEFEYRELDIWPDHGGILMTLTTQPKWSWLWFFLVWVPIGLLLYAVVGDFAGWPLQLVVLLLFAWGGLIALYLWRWLNPVPNG